MTNMGLAGQWMVASALAGLCWTVQLAVYAHFASLLRDLGPAAFRAYHARYVRSIGPVAAPLMLAEAALAVTALLPAQDAEIGTGDALSLASVALLWLHTFAIMVPLHRRLQTAPTVELAHRVARWNWWRTALWTLRVLALVMTQT